MSRLYNALSERLGSTDNLSVYKDSRFLYRPVAPKEDSSIGSFFDGVKAGAMSVAAPLLDKADSNTYLGSFANATRKGGAGTYGGIADFAHADDTAKGLNDYAASMDDPDAVEPGLNWNYITSPHGLTRSVGEAVGSTLALAPAMAVVPESAVGAGVGLLARLGGDAVVKGLVRHGMYTAAKQAASKAPFAVRYAMTSPFEAASEGGNTRREILDSGGSERDATLASAGTFAANIPLLTLSNLGEGALLGGAAKIPAKAGAGFFRRAVTAPFRAAPTAALEGLQNGIEEVNQEAISSAMTGKDYGILPWNYTDTQKRAFGEGFAGGVGLGAASGTAHAMSPRYGIGASEEEKAYKQGAPKAQAYDADALIKAVRQSMIENRTGSNASAISSGNANLDSLIASTAQKYGISPNLVHAVIGAESNYNQDARSDVGAIGMMQLMPSTAKELGVDPTTLEGNIEGGVKYLKQMLDMFDGDVEKAVAAYNAGPGAVQEHGGVPPFAETQNYVAKVLKNLESGGGEAPHARISLADAAAPFIGKRMDNGENGCVEAVTKVGAACHPFLANELKAGTVNVDVLVNHANEAGVQVIPFDAAQLEEGDVIVYGDEKDPQRHVVLYDGKGGYVGNSTRRQQVVHESDYNAMGESLRPTRIIKTGANFGTGSVLAPQMPDYTGLIADADSIKETENKLRALVEGDRLTPEQHTAILEAAQMIRDMPLGSEDNTEEATEYSAWQKLIDTKDAKGIFEKDPEKVAHIVHKLGMEQRSHRAPKQSEIERVQTPHLNHMKQQQTPARGTTPMATGEAGTGAISSAQNTAGTGLFVGNLKNDLLPVSTEPVPGSQPQQLGNVVENVPQQAQTQEGASMPPVSREEITGIMNRVAEWDARLAAKNPAYAMARNQQDWAAAGVLAQQAGEKGLAQFYNGVLREHSARNARDITPFVTVGSPAQNNAPVQTAAQTAPQMPQEAAANAGEAAPVSYARPSVPATLPKAVGKRRDIGRKLLKHMKHNNIPVAPMLFDDLIDGKAKAIRTAQEKIDEWEKNNGIGGSPATENAPQSAETGGRDTSVAPKKNLAQELYGDTEESAGTEDSARTDGEIAPGYRTESGRPLNEAGENEFIIQPDGTPNFGEIDKKIEQSTNGELLAGKIRLKVGNTDYGLIHAKKHEREAIADGYSSIEDMILDVAQNFDEIYEHKNEGRTANYVLVKYGNKSTGKMNGVEPVYFELSSGDDGNFYIILTAIPKGDANLRRQTKKERLVYSRPRVGSAAIPDDGAVSAKERDNAGSSPERFATSDTQGVPVASSVAQEEEKDKGKEAHKKSAQMSDAKSPNFNARSDSMPTDDASVSQDAQENKGEKSTLKQGVLIRGRTGKETTITTDSGKEIKAHYRLVPAKEVITSHTADGAHVNPAYPTELQPRDRQRVSMRLQVESMARSLRPADLAGGRNLNQGAPVMRADGVVLNGNGRANAIRMAQESVPNAATTYKKYLVQHAAEFGFKPDDVMQMKNPMLVRVVDGDVPAQLIEDIIGSTAGGSALSASEQAAADAKKIKAGTLDLYVPNETGDFTAAANSDFVAAVLRDIAGKNDFNALTDHDGNVSADGISRVKRAVFSLAYGDAGLVAKMAESTDDNIRNVSRGLLAAAPGLAKLNANMKKGTAHDYPLSDAVSAAAKTLEMLRTRGQSVENYLSNEALFSEHEESAPTKVILEFFDRNKRSGKRITEFLQHAVQGIESEGNPDQVSMFDTEQLSLEEILHSAAETAEGKRGAGEVPEGLSADGARVYRDLAQLLEEFGGKTKRVARMAALLFARHADMYAKAYAKHTGKPYTAMDYYNKKFGLDTAGAFGDSDGLFQAMMPDIDLDERVSVLDLDGMTNRLTGKTDKDILAYIRDLAPMEPIPTADFRALVGLPKGRYGRKHLIRRTARRNVYAQNVVLSNIKDVLPYARVIEVVPNKDIQPLEGLTGTQARTQRRKNAVKNYYRIMLPIKLDGRIETLALIAEDRDGQISVEPQNVSLYEIFVPEKKKTPLPASSQKRIVAAKEASSVTDSVTRDEANGNSSDVTIRDMLSGISDYYGDPYINADGTGNFTQLASDYARKEAQLAVIKRHNPMQDDMHTGIRSVEDILAPEEAFRTTEKAIDDGDFEGYSYPDFTLKQGLEALDKGEITLYSSKPIIEGGFVSPSKMMAQDYAGDGKVYSKTVPISDVAWLNADEGQYAPVVDTVESYEQTAWHGSPYSFASFDLGKIGMGEGHQVHGWGLYFAKNRELSEMYKKMLGEQKNANNTLFDEDKLQEMYDRLERQAARAPKEKRESEYAKVAVLEHILTTHTDEGIEDDDALEPDAVTWFKEHVRAGVLNPEYGNDTSMLYQVDIPEDDVLLDEQKYFDEQSPQVQEALRGLQRKFDKKEQAYRKKRIAGLKGKVGFGRSYAYDLSQKFTDIAQRHNDAVRAFEQKAHQIMDAAQDRDQGRMLVRAEEEKLDALEKKLIDEGTDRIADMEARPFRISEDMTGRDIYASLTKKMERESSASIVERMQESPREASLALNAVGIKGITYVGGRDGRCYVVFGDKAVKIIETYNQEHRKEIQGRISNMPDGKRIISLFESADESTFLHEMGHMFLMDLHELATMSNAAARDVSAVEKWTAWHEGAAEEYKDTPWAEEFAAREKKILAAEKKGDKDAADHLKEEWMQERFARGFERYLHDGKAPNSTLARVFEQLKKLLTDVYHAFMGEGGKPSEDVRRVMDRMLSYEETENDATINTQGKEVGNQPLYQKTSASARVDVPINKGDGKVLDVKFIAVDEGEALTGEHIGVRFDDGEYKLGKKLKRSWRWDDGSPTKERLDGTSAVNVGESWSYDNLDELKKVVIDRLNKNGGGYPYDHAYLVKGTNSEYGEDTHEVVIENAKVIGILDIVRESEANKVEDGDMVGTYTTKHGHLSIVVRSKNNANSNAVFRFSDYGIEKQIKETGNIKSAFQKLFDKEEYAMSMTEPQEVESGVRIATKLYKKYLASVGEQVVDKDAETTDNIVKEADELYQKAIENYPEAEKEAGHLVREAIQLTLDFGEREGDIIDVSGNQIKGGTRDDISRGNLSSLLGVPNQKDQSKRGKLLGLGITRALVEQGAVSLIGQKVTSVKQLAEAAQVLRHPGYEKFHLVYTDATGRVQHHETVSAQLPGLASVNFPGDGVADTVRRIEENLKKFKATTFYMIHNHPSSDPTPSPEDFAATKSFLPILNPLGNRAYGGHLVLDHNKYALIDKELRCDVRSMKGGASPTYDVAELEHPALGKKISEPDDVTRIAELYAGEAESHVFFVTSKLKVRAVQKLHDDFARLSDDGMLRYLRYSARGTASRTAILVTKNRKLHNKMSSIINNGLDEGILESVLIADRKAVELGRTAAWGKGAHWFGENIRERLDQRKRLLERQGEYRARHSDESAFSIPKNPVTYNQVMADRWQGNTPLERVLNRDPKLEKMAIDFGAQKKDGAVSFASKAKEEKFLKIARALQDGLINKFSLNSWQGSPHDFDAISFDFIGSGEGFQAHGHGGYSAEQRGVAEGYRDRWQGGKLYHLEIPDADVLLDEQKDYAEQSKKVQKAIDRLLKGLTDEQLNDWDDVSFYGRTKVLSDMKSALYDGDGEHIYRTISSMLGGDKYASELFNKYGIKGITYDGQQDGRCYVVFDEKNMKIVEKFSAMRRKAIEKMLSEMRLIDDDKLTKAHRAIADMGEELGVPVVFFKGNKDLHGFHDPRSGVTFLNVDSDISPRWVFWHETLHWMKANNPGLYRDLVQAIEGREGFTKKQLDAYREKIGAFDMSDADVIEEMIADALPDVKGRVAFLRDVGKANTSIVQRFVAWIHDVMRRFHEHLKAAGAGLTYEQRGAMVTAFGNLVGSLRDSEGRLIFRVQNEGTRILLRDGSPLPAVKYSASDASRVDAQERLEGDVKKWEALCDRYASADKTQWKKNHDGDLYDFMDMPVVLEMISNNNMQLQVYGSFFQHALRSVHKGMTMTIVKQLPKAMADPVMILRGNNARYVFVLDLKDGNGATILVPVEIQKTDARHGVVNIVNTAYGKTKKDGITPNTSWFENQILRGNLLYLNKKKALTGAGPAGLGLNLQSPNGNPALLSALSNLSIKTDADLVKEKSKNPLRYSISLDDDDLKFSVTGNFRHLMNRIKEGPTAEDNLEIEEMNAPRKALSQNVSPHLMWKFKMDKHLTEKDIVSREPLPNGDIRVTYYAHNANDIGYIDKMKSVRQVALRNPFVEVLYNLAKKAMHIQEHLRNEYGKSMKTVGELLKKQEDHETAAAILWQGDSEGKAYNDTELRSMGASDNVVKAYKLIREELGKAYRQLNDARMQVRTRTKRMSPSEVETFKKTHWIKDGDVLSTVPVEGNKVLLTWRGGKTYETEGRIVSAEELAGLQSDENIIVTGARKLNAKQHGTGMYSVDYVERIRPIHNLTGYMPHFFHEWMIYEVYKDTEGKTHYASVGSGRTMNEAVRIGNQFAAANRDKKYVLRAKGFDMGAENTVVIGDMDFAEMSKKLAESTEMSLSEAREFLQNKAGASLKSRHRHFGNMMKRKGAKGFDQNMFWVLGHYFNSAARYIGMEQFKPDAISMYERAFGSFNAETKNRTAQFCKNLINDVNGNPRGVEEWLNDLIKDTWIGKRVSDTYGDRAALAINGELSTWNAITKLGVGNFASAAVNFSQFINVGAALNSYAYARKGLMRALHPDALDEKIIEASGLLDDINLAADNGGYSQRRGGYAGTAYAKAKKFGEWTLMPFQWADTLMRKAAVLGAYYQGIEKLGMKKAPGDELSAEALTYAQDINDAANFDYSAANAPEAFRAGSVVTQQLFQFMKYPIMQFEFMYNILRHGTHGQKVRMFVPYVIFCGLGGSIPFGDLFNSLFSFMFGLATGDKDKDIAQDIKAEVLRWAGKDPVKKAIAETALYGVLAPTFGLDISGRIGMNSAFSGQFYGEKPDSTAGVVANMLGGPALNSAVNMLRQAHEGNPIEALKAVSPALGNMAQAWAGESRTTRHRVNSRYDTTYDKIAHALGFRTAEESNKAFIMHYEYGQKDKAKRDKQDAIRAYIDDPSPENRQVINALGIKDKQIEEARVQMNRTAIERATKGRPNTSGKPSTRRKEEKKEESLYDVLDDED
jgi:hypothetical protein